MRAIDAEELKRSIAVSALIEDQKTLEQIIDEQPTIEPERENGIPRDAIEYILRKETVSTNPDDFTANEKFIKFMDDPEIASFGRWQHANGFNTALVAVECDLDKIPDSEPERETGKWLAIVAELGDHKIIVEGYNCSKCGRYDAEKDNFCPDCGARMEGK